jgi:hypothetical protein
MIEVSHVPFYTQSEGKRTPQLAHPHPAQFPAHPEQLEHPQGPIFVGGIWVVVSVGRLISSKIVYVVMNREWIW